MDNELISVIVPCYNQEEYIEEALGSVLAQTYGNWECIIVNDGSSDGSRERIESFIRGEARFRLTDIPNSGVSKARNEGVARASGKYIFPLDGDDHIHADCLKDCLAAFAGHPEVKLVCPQGQLFGAEEGRWELPAFDYATMLHHNMIHNSSLYLKKDFDRVGGYRTNMVHGLEDWDFLIALLYKAEKAQVIQLPQTRLYYRVKHSGRRLTAESSGRQGQMLDRIIYNNFAIYQEYFPGIFDRIHEYDFDKTMLNKRPVKAMVNTLIWLSRFKNRLTGQSK